MQGPSMHCKAGGSQGPRARRGRNRVTCFNQVGAPTRPGRLFLAELSVGSCSPLGASRQSGAPHPWSCWGSASTWGQEAPRQVWAFRRRPVAAGAVRWVGALGRQGLPAEAPSPGLGSLDPRAGGSDRVSGAASTLYLTPPTRF